MLLLLDEKHKEHLVAITDFDVEVVRDFCRISIEALTHGFKPKTYSNAAAKLGVESTIIEDGVRSLVHLFQESVKLNLGDLDFQDSLLANGIKKDFVQILLTTYKVNSENVRNILSDMDLSLPQFKDIHWRLDVQLGSRSLRHTIDPLITLQFKLNKNGKDEIINLQTDPVNLIHMTQVFEQALQQSKSQHCRRVIKHVK